MNTNKRKTKGTADVIDKHVGLRIRNRRTLMGLSQEKLADSVGVTFQQVQKYERGTNRVSASRLYRFSKLLGVSIDYFYEGLGEKEHEVLYGMLKEEKPDIEKIMGDAKSIPEDLLTHKETLELVRKYYAISDKKKRRKILGLIDMVAG